MHCIFYALEGVGNVIRLSPRPSSSLNKDDNNNNSMLIPQLRDRWLSQTVLHSPDDCLNMTWHGKNMISGAVKQIL